VRHLAHHSSGAGFAGHAARPSGGTKQSSRTPGKTEVSDKAMLRQLAQNDGKLAFIRGLCQLRLFAADWGLLELGALAAELKLTAA
jgi:hypothetical protein